MDRTISPNKKTLNKKQKTKYKIKPAAIKRQETTAQSMRRNELLMELRMYSVRDSKGEIYHPPFFNKTHGEAERNFRELAKDPKSMIAKYPEDYDLFFLGTYCDQTGKMDSLDTPQHIVKAANLAHA